jgi:hypothetical protein
MRLQCSAVDQFEHASKKFTIHHVSKKIKERKARSVARAGPAREQPRRAHFPRPASLKTRPPHQLGGAHKLGAPYSSRRAPHPPVGPLPLRAGEVPARRTTRCLDEEGRPAHGHPPSAATGNTKKKCEAVARLAHDHAALRAANSPHLARALPAHHLAGVHRRDAGYPPRGCSSRRGPPGSRRSRRKRSAHGAQATFSSLSPPQPDRSLQSGGAGWCPPEGLAHAQRGSPTPGRGASMREGSRCEE